MYILINQFNIAYCKRNLKLVKFLDLNIQNNYRKNCFHYACKYRYFTIVEFFKVLEVCFWSFF